MTKITKTQASGVLTVLAPALELELCLRSFREFVQRAWPAIEPSTSFIPGYHIDAICEHLQAVSEGHVQRLLIALPPRCMKSTLVSVLWPAWEWSRRAGEPRRLPAATRWLFASYSQELA